MEQPDYMSFEDFLNQGSNDFLNQEALSVPGFDLLDHDPSTPIFQNKLMDSQHIDMAAGLTSGIIMQEFGINETDNLDYGNFAKWIPRFSKPDSPCEYCRSRQLECWFTFENQTGCSACAALFRPCSFKSNEIHPTVLMDTLHVVQEDVVQKTGELTGVKALRCWDRTPLDDPSMEDDERPSRRSTGTRFPREAIKVLKNWNETHADYPYPSENEKDEIAQLTGLSVGQVSNWFANTRRRNKRRSVPKRGLSPSIRSPTWGTSSESIPIPAGKRHVTLDGKTWDIMNPLERWKASPPENEPATVSAIAHAVANSRTISNESSLSRRQSRNQLELSASESLSIHRAASVTSFETGQSDSRQSSGSFSNHSLNSSRSHGSRNSLHSYGSGQRTDRRRRRRAALAAPRNPQSNENRPFQCTFCTDTFRTKFDWTRHEKSFHLSLEKWICAPIGDVITNPTTGERLCVFCENANPSDEHLEMHNHRACEEKGMGARTFYRKDHLRQHLRLVHGCQMVKSMDSWKSEAAYIRSRCGFCNQDFTSWTERCDHLAKHFRNGAKMKDWSGCRGLDSDVAALVTHAMPPFLIGTEANSPNPFRASNEASMGLSGDGPKTALGTCTILPSSPSQRQQRIVNSLAMDSLHDWNPSVDFIGSLIPSREFNYDFDSNPGAHFLVPDFLEHHTRPAPKISTCWEILTLRLGEYVKEQLQLGFIPTDDMLQRHARWILYESDDDWNQTAADNREWLELFKKAHGLPSTSTDTRVDWMEDLGVGIGELSFDAVIQDGSWDAPSGLDTLDSFLKPLPAS